MAGVSTVDKTPRFPDVTFSLTRSQSIITVQIWGFSQLTT
jgi:hypothetical protein